MSERIPTIELVLLLAAYLALGIVSALAGAPAFEGD
jgi:hypothetical protein